MNETVNHQHRRIWILLAAAAAAVVLLAVAWVGAANAQGSSSNFESGQSILSSLASESSNATMLPGFVAESGMGSQVAETAKYLISSEVATYWAALDEKGSVCIVTVPSAGPQFAAVSCSTQDDFLSHGVVIAVKSEAGTSWGAYLLPDGSYLSETHRGIVALNASVLEVDPELLTSQELIGLTNNEGTEGSVVLRPFPGLETR